MPFFGNNTGKVLDGLQTPVWVLHACPPNCPGNIESMRKKIWGDECQNNREDNIKFMAQAFIDATGLDPTDAVLVEQHDGNVTKWWFEKKEI